MTIQKTFQGYIMFIWWNKYNKMQDCWVPRKTWWNVMDWIKG